MHATEGNYVFRNAPSLHMDTNRTANTNTRKPGKKRIMVQVWGTLAKAVDRDLKALHLKRDGFLNDLFTREIEKLAEEVTFCNSDAVQARLREQKLPDRARLTLELDETLVQRIDAVLEHHKIPRDSFVNRVLFFLVAKESHLDRLGIVYEREGQVSAKPLADVRSYLYQPFSHIRDANEGRFYTLACFKEHSFGEGWPNLFALNTAISDADWEEMNTAADILGELGL